MDVGGDIVGILLGALARNAGMLSVASLPIVGIEDETSGGETDGVMLVSELADSSGYRAVGILAGKSIREFTGAVAAESLSPVAGPNGGSSGIAGKSGRLESSAAV
jgi:hypothetical protein